MKETIAPPREIPRNLLDQFTMGRLIPVEDWYLNDSCFSTGALVYTKTWINELMKKVSRGETNYYGQTDKWLYECLKKYTIANKSVVIMGSRCPWYESVCLYYEGKCTVIDYNQIVSEDSRIETMTVDEFANSPKEFDAGFSISSFEHDGLGRYGEPINPDGDLQAMEKMKGIVKSDGLLFLSVPLGRDTLVWNAHRIYGAVRLPLLLKGWRLLDSFGFDSHMLKQDTAKGRRYEQPIFVLQNRRTGLH